MNTTVLSGIVGTNPCNFTCALILDRSTRRVIKENQFWRGPESRAVTSTVEAEEGTTQSLNKTSPTRKVSTLKQRTYRATAVRVGSTLTQELQAPAAVRSWVRRLGARELHSAQIYERHVAPNRCMKREDAAAEHRSHGFSTAKPTQSTVCSSVILPWNSLAWFVTLASLPVAVGVSSESSGFT